MVFRVTPKRLLIIYYSYSGQTRKLINSFAAGLERKGVAVDWLAIRPRNKMQFPLRSIPAAMKMMVETFFRKRIDIEQVDSPPLGGWDMIVLAGPTWSYHPCGPVLSFFDRYGEIFQNARVLPFISCRGYWRAHYYQLKYMLTRRKAKVLRPLVFLHTGPEPWRTIGVFLKMGGKMPEANTSWISRYYTRFGHTREQVEYAGVLGERFASAMVEEKAESWGIQVVKNVSRHNLEM